jgi:ubiquinone/menaquinone biosynthesis C-methylase UbiE
MPDNGPMAEFDPDIGAYYEEGEEAGRLFGGFPSGPLERIRTQEILDRYMPTGPLNILDVGGGPGVYAAWLAERGHRVHVVEPVELHVAQAEASHPEVSAELGDARKLRQGDDTIDVVLLLGPLYHLVERRDRLAALREAGRVLRAGGMVFVAAISRFASLFDLLVRLDRLHEEEVYRVVERAVRTGVHLGAEAGLFTTAYFHLPGELAEEVSEAGFDDCELLQVEGPGFLVSNFEERWADPDRREAMLRAARLVESQPDLLAASSHLIAIARAP